MTENLVPTDDQILALNKYLKSAWVFKLRLMSSRRHLWAKECSLIHIETSVLQIRKCCEAIGFMSLSMAGIEGVNLKKRERKTKYPGEIFATLDRLSITTFPRRARFSQHGNEEQTNIWKLEIDSNPIEDKKRVKNIFSFSGDILHEFHPENKDDFYSNYSHQNLFDMLNIWRGHHQWLWNSFWCHAAIINEELFCINLGSTENINKPQVIAENGLATNVGNIELDPKAILDFDGPFNWPL
tara:strand:+ start:59 stop:781 length:723 start_codon:yes stop_codon:yes gene_type:complete